MGIPQNIRQADTAAREALLKAIAEVDFDGLPPQGLAYVAQAYNYVASTNALRETAPVAP